MTSENCRLLLIGNPTTMSGAFRSAFYESRDLYHAITISALESPNVKEGKAIIRGLTSRKWVEERKKIWGEENPICQARVLGEFPDQAEDTLIPLPFIEKAVGRFQAASAGYPPPGMGRDEVCLASTEEGENRPSPVPSTIQGEGIQALVVVAVDVARFGSDKSVILRRRGMIVEEVQAYHGLDTMKLTGLVVSAIQTFRPHEITVDEVGIGAGVVDRLHEQGYPVQGVNVGRAPKDNDHSQTSGLRLSGTLGRFSWRGISGSRPTTTWWASSRLCATASTAWGR